MTQEVQVQVSILLWAYQGFGQVTFSALLCLQGLKKVEEFLLLCLESC